MFTIQYEAVDGTHQMQTFNGSRLRFIVHLTRFQRPIMAVYENATPITKAIKSEVAKWPGSKSHAARDFVTNRD